MAAGEGQHHANEAGGGETPAGAGSAEAARSVLEVVGARRPSPAAGERLGSFPLPPSSARCQPGKTNKQTINNKKEQW